MPVLAPMLGPSRPSAKPLLGIAPVKHPCASESLGLDSDNSFAASMQWQ